MALVKLPSGDMWDPDRLSDPKPEANQEGPETQPDPEPYRPERLDAEIVSGWTICPWCGMEPEGTMAAHVKALHSVEISEDITMARQLRGLE